MSHRLISILTNTGGSLIISADRRPTRSSSGTVMMIVTGIIGMISMKLMKNGDITIMGTTTGIGMIIMVVTGIPFFFKSVEINEQSGNAGGLPQWPAKSLVMIGFAMLLAQAVSEVIKRVAVIRGMIPDPHESQVHALEAEVEHIVEAIEKH